MDGLGPLVPLFFFTTKEKRQATFFFFMGQKKSLDRVVFSIDLCQMVLIVLDLDHSGGIVPYRSSC